jgi:hypothetical protein
MKAIFYASRLFKTSDGWWIYMKRGDEKIVSFINLTKVSYYMKEEVPIAGPFNRKCIAKRWFNGFIEAHWKFKSTKNYISDRIVITESCYI